MIIVSACLAGINCKYDGSNNTCPSVIKLIKKGKAIPVCPEQLGGLPTPRIPCEQKQNRVITRAGQDVTRAFIKGAKEALKIAKISNCQQAILKSKSPSCGIGKIYDGTFSGKLINGNGIFTKLLQENKIKVITENELNNKFYNLK